MEVNTGEVLEVAMKISAEEQTEGATKKVSIGERTEGATKKGTTGERIMKKVSTGERIKLEDLRRRSVGGQRNADIDVTSEQRFVSELMDTTPSSSYEEPSRDLTSNLDASVSDSPLPKYDSDVEAADEVVTGTQDTVTKIDLIVKEDVPEIPGETQQGSLLAAELAAVKFTGSQPSQTVSARQRDDTLSDGESLMGDPRVDHGADHGRGGGGCTAEQLIRALVSECQTLELSSDLRQPSDKYVLRMADDDWDPDLDFPGLDSSAVITDVGVDQFVLCHQAKNEPMLHVTIALHEGLNGSLTGTGAVEAPGAGATMTLEVNFRIPGQDETHHMSVRIAPDSIENDLLHSRDSESRNGAVNAVCESEEILRTESDAKENHEHDGHGGQDGHDGHDGHGGRVEEVNSEGNRPVSEAAEEEETLKLRNIDTGEDIELGEIDERVPPSLDPGELFRSKDVS